MLKDRLPQEKHGVSFLGTPAIDPSSDLDVVLQPAPSLLPSEPPPPALRGARPGHAARPAQRAQRVQRVRREHGNRLKGIV